jgi:hypothetical protein
MDTTANPDRPMRPAAAPSAGPRGRSLGTLLSDLWRETTNLVHDEAELAKADVSEKFSQALNGVGAIATAGAILFGGFMMLLLAATGALWLVLPREHALWLAPLIVGAVVVVVGLIALSSGRSKLKAESLKPSRSIESLRRDRELAKEHMQ